MKFEYDFRQGKFILTDRFGGTWEVVEVERDAPDAPFWLKPLTRSEAWKKLREPGCTLNHEGPCNIACSYP